MENENKKIGFFARIKIAVTKLEDYGLFLGEKTSTAIQYFFLIVLFLSLVMGIVQTYSVMQMVNKGYHYIQKEMPDFSYQNESLQFSENVSAYDEEFDFYMIADTSNDLSQEQMKEYRNKIKSVGIILLKDKAIYKSGLQEVEYRYSDFLNQYGMDNFDKTRFLQEIDSIGMWGIAITIFLLIVVGIYIIQVISIFMDWLVMSVFAVIAARICRIIMPFKAGFNISIYALTLSIILSMVYNIAYYLIGFYTEYFRLVYLLISYVYVVAAILMMKSDLLKQQAEVGKIIDVQKKIHEESENPEQTEEDKKENKKPEEKDKKNEKDPDDHAVNGEPDGSEI